MDYLLPSVSVDYLELYCLGVIVTSLIKPSSFRDATAASLRHFEGLYAGVRVQFAVTHDKVIQLNTSILILPA
jgi:hypothetical protein